MLSIQTQLAEDLARVDQADERRETVTAPEMVIGSPMTSLISPRIPM